MINYKEFEVIKTILNKGVSTAEAIYYNTNITKPTSLKVCLYTLLTEDKSRKYSRKGAQN